VAQEGSAPSFGTSEGPKGEAADLQNQNTQEEPSKQQADSPVEEPVAPHSGANGRTRVATSLLLLVLALSGLFGSST
jgi:hypothetical protein